MYIYKYIFHSRVQINLYMHCNMIYGDGKCIFVQEIANAYIYTVYIQATHGPGGLWEWSIRVEAKLFAFFSSECSCFLVCLMLCHTWISASRPMSPASAFRHPSSQSGTGLDPLILEPGWFRRRPFFHSAVGLTGCRSELTDWMPDSPQFGM